MKFSDLNDKGEQGRERPKEINELKECGLVKAFQATRRELRKNQQLDKRGFGKTTKEKMQMCREDEVKV